MFTSPATGSAGLVKQRYCKEEVRPTGERCRRLPRYTDVSRTGALHTCSFTPHPFHHFSPASETEAYCILIANVNYREGSMTLYGRTITCPRGDSIKSLDTWHAFSAGAKPVLDGLPTDRESGYPSDGLGVIMVVKHRNGETGNVYFGHNKSMTTIGDYVPPMEYMLKHLQVNSSSSPYPSKSFLPPCDKRKKRTSCKALFFIIKITDCISVVYYSSTLSSTA